MYDMRKVPLQRSLEQRLREAFKEDIGRDGKVLYADGTLGTDVETHIQFVLGEIPEKPIDFPYFLDLVTEKLDMKKSDILALIPKPSSSSSSSKPVWKRLPL